MARGSAAVAASAQPAEAGQPRELAIGVGEVGQRPPVQLAEFAQRPPQRPPVRRDRRTATRVADEAKSVGGFNGLASGQRGRHRMAGNATKPRGMRVTSPPQHQQFGGS